MNKIPEFKSSEEAIAFGQANKNNGVVCQELKQESKRLLKIFDQEFKNRISLKTWHDSFKIAFRMQLLNEAYDETQKGETECPKISMKG